MIDASKMPNRPGCYIFKDSKGRIIYIGKAKNLKKRVSSYFRPNSDPKTLALTDSISEADFIVTDNEVEALILENNLIKKHQPKYNICLKDAKRYAYLRFTDERFPRLVISRSLSDGKGYGPFVSAEERDMVMKEVTNTFKLRTCKRVCKRPGLRYHMGLCAACGGGTEKDYNDLVKQAVQVLKGNTEKLITELKERMNHHSSNLEFEKAKMYRDRIKALTYLDNRQKMERNRRNEEDIINYIIAEGKVHLLLFSVHKGMLLSKRDYIFDAKPNFLNEFLLLHYTENPVPKEIIIPAQPDLALGELLSKLKGSPVSLHVPKAGEKRELLDLAYRNAELHFFKDNSKVYSLQSALQLSYPPRKIECFDISHLSGTLMVGSMVRFHDGRADKAGYRRFRIKNVESIDDCKAIAEMVSRRYSRLLAENRDFPDLIVVDGGKGQLSSALGALSKLNLTIPVIALAKRLEEIFLPWLSKPVRLQKSNPGLQYLQQIRDEAHRFAIKYNRLLRSKKLKE